MSSTSPPKILLLIPHLGGGGAEHVAATLARFLSHEKYEVHLGLVTQFPAQVEMAVKQFPDSVRVYGLGARRVRWSAWKIFKLVWRVRPAVILSGMAHLNLLVLLLRPVFPSRTRILVRQNGELAATLEAGKHPRLSKLSFRRAYKRADQVICQTNSMAEEVRSTLGVDPQRLLVLPNPVDIPTIRALAEPTYPVGSPAEPRILAVARLAPEKGVDLLLEAFARIKDTFSSARLQIAGSGPCASALRAQCTNLGLDGNVEFLGQVESPAQLFRDASIFVLPSRHEGLPNALLEAAASGLPIVATPSSRGLTELLRDRAGVWLASDVSAAAVESALFEALTDLRPGERIKHEWIEAFDQGAAVRAYEATIDRSLLVSRA